MNMVADIMDLKKIIKQLSKEYTPYYIKVRRYLHQNPELSFQEFNTCAFIREELEKIGIVDITPVAGTGLLASFNGNKSGRTILLRADMDALPIREESQLDYTSRNNGVMHACGHDVHMASLLLCARVLYHIKSDLNGTIKLLFQPGEEIMPGGATLVLKEKRYNDLGVIPHIGQHVRPDLPAGKVGFCSGKFMASMDELFLRITGKGGHAATPESTIDPVLIASHIIVAAQQLVSRMSSPKVPSVLSFGKVIANGAINIIPDTVSIEGTFRTLDETWRQHALMKLEKLACSIAEGMGGKCELRINHGYPSLHNDKDLTQESKANAESYLGEESVLESDIWMASEDFAYYSQRNPSCFYLLGVGNENDGINSGLHTPTFNIDETALEVGGGLMAWLAIQSLNNQTIELCR
ncbi:M20 family metallopeptidase [Arenibacter sp. S6351L]|uniref:M20 metallopeptidase family protein n=1 Tax=Arenibacter sp. S6351L TaxID=2926407 RepID=UPI001FF1F3D4|nr:M20 family metallopeptidase [Arenibacter sp. S6351L]MCK0135325.1 M20 family metallopeptidase [Arenibacter sp. S6351L]